MDLDSILEFMKTLNLIDFFNFMTAPGIGEAIMIIVFIGFWVNGCLMIIPFALNRGIIIHYLRAKMQNRLLVKEYTTDGLLKYFTLPAGTKHYEEVDSNDIKSVWEIRREGIEREPNGVRSTILHPTIAFNVTADQLAKHFAGKLEGSIFNPQEQAKFIDSMAHHDAALIDDSMKKYMPLLIGVGLLIGFGIMVYIITYALGQLNFCSAAADSMKSLGATTTTVTLSPIR
jgi:hypothetical protein